MQATWLPNHDVLITDQGNDRVIMVTPAKKIVWQYGKTGVAGRGADQLNTPNSAELLRNGHILIADEGGNRVIEVTRAKKIVWSDSTGLSAPAFASRLPNGHTLITDGGNNRVIEVNHAGTVVWSYVTNTQPGSNANPAPSQAVRLRDGDTLIADQFNDRVIAGHQGRQHPLELRRSQHAGQGGRSAERTLLGQGHRRLYGADATEVLRSAWRQGRSRARNRYAALTCRDALTGVTSRSPAPTGSWSTPGEERVQPSRP